MAFLKEFKEFALKGNVMDMAVGVIIGGAFGKIVSSLVNDILMPPIGALIGNTDFSMRKKEEAAAPAPAPEPAPTKEELLLAEIRDLLREQKK